MAQIEDTIEAWESGTLGRDPKSAERLDEAQWAKEKAEIDEGLGLKAISIRLEKELIEDFKMIAKLNGIGYQPLMRQALKRFAECEKKRILTEMYNAKVQEERARDGSTEEPTGIELKAA